MKRFYLWSASLVVLAGVFAMPAFAQKWEVYPYAGTDVWNDFRPFPDAVDRFALVNPGTFGIKFGGFATGNLQIEGNVGYQNQFRLRSPFDPKSRAWIYEGGVNYNFSKVSRFSPYVAGSVGAMRINLSDNDDLTDDNIVVYPVAVRPFDIGGELVTTRAFIIEDGDSFFTFSMGGGMRFDRLFGPVGFRFDLRARGVPNFYGDDLWALEPTGGITISWGER